MLARSKWVKSLLTVSCSERAAMLGGPGVPLTSNGGIIKTGRPLPGGSAAAVGCAMPDGAVAPPGAGTRRCDNATTAAITISATAATTSRRIDQNRSSVDDCAVAPGKAGRRLNVGV